MTMRPPSFRLSAAKVRKAWAKPSVAADIRIRGRKGQELRRRHLQGEPLCRECQKAGLVVAATIVDHIVGLAEGQRRGWSADQIEAPTNKQSLCKRHSDEKTAGESHAARGSRYGGGSTLVGR